MTWLRRMLAHFAPITPARPATVPHRDAPALARTKIEVARVGRRADLAVKQAFSAADAAIVASRRHAARR